MADGTSTLSRTQLLYGVCLPLAALIGFFLAEPLQFSSLAVLGVIGFLLCWPLFVRWCHLLLVAAIHSTFILAFLPGSMPLWTVLAFGGFFITLLHRALNPRIRMFPPGAVPWAMVGLAGVVVFTAMARGGIGLGALGSSSMGGKKYIFILLAIMAYFLLVSRPVSQKRALLYVALFCLSGLTALLGHLAYMGGSKFYWLFRFIDATGAAAQARADWDVQGNAIFRSTATIAVANAFIGLMMFTYGVRGIFDMKKPWRVALLLVCVAGGMVGGFRSFVVGTFLTFAILFFLEGLHRSRYLAVAVAVGVAAFGVLALFSDRLPHPVQRAISFLPVKVDQRVRQDAQGSIDWRLQMWRAVWPEVPTYLLIGKGYGMDAEQLEMSRFSAAFGFGIQAEWAVLAGDYHNGPLSVVIPFGIWGVLAFGVFLVAGMRRLLWFCRHGPADLLRINRALCAMFIAKTIFFLFFFGAFGSDLLEFVVLVGLAECLNHPAREEIAAPAPEPQETGGFMEEEHA